MNELIRAVLRARAVKTSSPVVEVVRNKRENLIRISLKFQGLSEPQIQDIIDRAREIEVIHDDDPKPLLDHIVTACCTYYGISRDEFMSSRRPAKLVKARQIAFWCAKTMTGRTLASIGAYMNKDRTNIEHGYVMISHKIKEDDMLLTDVENIKREIRQYVREHQKDLGQGIYCGNNSD